MARLLTRGEFRRMLRAAHRACRFALPASAKSFASPASRCLRHTVCFAKRSGERPDILHGVHPPNRINVRQRVFLRFFFRLSLRRRLPCHSTRIIFATYFFSPMLGYFVFHIFHAITPPFYAFVSISLFVFRRCPPLTLLSILMLTPLPVDYFRCRRRWLPTLPPAFHRCPLSISFDFRQQRSAMRMFAVCVQQESAAAECRKICE